MNTFKKKEGRKCVVALSAKEAVKELIPNIGRNAKRSEDIDMVMPLMNLLHFRKMAICGTLTIMMNTVVHQIVHDIAKDKSGEQSSVCWKCIINGARNR